MRLALLGTSNGITSRCSGEWAKTPSRILPEPGGSLEIAKSQIWTTYAHVIPGSGPREMLSISQNTEVCIAFGDFDEIFALDRGKPSLFLIPL